MTAGRVPTARSVAVHALQRIERDGAYANRMLPAMLSRSRLSPQDRAFTTELVYGTTRMRRACDAATDRFVVREPDPSTRTLLRVGAYQLLFAGIPPHAAVGETVAVAPPRSRSFVNAILRRVASTPMQWPNDAVRLSYPDWMVELFRAEIGEEAEAALERMNVAPPVTARPDGYVQDLASQWVAGALGARSGELVLDACAGPGGKATLIAGLGAQVVGADVRLHRAQRVAANARRVGADVAAVVADASSPPFPRSSFDHVLVDAPCSGLGALRRRPDARWRISRDAIGDLAALQRRILSGAAALVRPGGTLLYSVCTITSAESIAHPTPGGMLVDPLDLGPPWRPFWSGYRLLPHDADTDGMVVIRYRRHDG